MTGVQVAGVNKGGQTIGRKGAESRARLIDAAREMLPDVPVQKLTASAIARRAGLASQTFYLYFRDVEELLLQLCFDVTRDAQGLVKTFDQPGSSQTLMARAEVFVGDFYLFWDRHRPVLNIRNFFADAGIEAFVEERNKASLPIVQRIAAGISAAHPDGEVTASDALARAAIIFAAIERMAQRYSKITQAPSIMNSADLKRAEAHILSLLLSPSSPQR